MADEIVVIVDNPISSECIVISEGVKGNPGPVGTTDYNALSNKPTIPSSLSALTDDSTHRLTTDTEKGIWYGKQNHSIALDSVSGTNTGDQDLSGLVVKITGKGLSTEDYSTSEKNKLAGVAEGAEVNVNADWNATTGDSFIANKPDIPTTLASLSDDSTHRLVTDTEKSTWSGKQDHSTALDNVSGTNTGDETATTIKTKLSISTLSGSNTGDQTTTAGLTNSTNKNMVTDAQLTVISNTSGDNSGDSATPAETAVTIAAINHGATAKSALLDADELSGMDSATSFSLIRSTWTNVKAFLKTYFDSLYPLSAGKSGGQKLIGGSEVTDILKLQGTSGDGTATSPAMQVLVGNNGGTVAETTLNNGNKGIGTTSPLTKLNVIDTSTSSPRGILSSQFSDTTDGARVGFAKARGTLATPTTVATGDMLGRDVFRGYDGTNFLEMGSIDVGVSGTVATTRVPTYMSFSTATDAAPSVLTERMRILNNGNVGIGTTAPTAPLHIPSTATPAILVGDGSIGHIKIGNVGLDVFNAGIVTMNGAKLALINGTSGLTQTLGLHLNLNGVLNGGNSITFKQNTSDGTNRITSEFGGIITDVGNATYGGALLFNTVYNGSTLTERMRISSNGNVGIGMTSPTAYLHLKAGVASANIGAPLKFTSGTDLTTAETGAMEYDGTNLHFTPTGTLRENIHFGSKGSTTLTAGTTTTITTAGAKTTSVILIQSTSAAATLLSIYVSTKSAGSFVLTHTTAAGTETVDWVIIN